MLNLQRTHKAAQPRPALRALIPTWPWQELAARVREFRPDVVVLVARKMPRLVELFDLDFGPVELVISDLAIPFVHRYVRNAKVAILDDVVNVGSTLQHAADSIKVCGAREVELFCLARKSGFPFQPQVTCVVEDALTGTRYDQLVGSVPQGISLLAKPYDLVFPIIPCDFVVPFCSAGEVIVALRDRLGADVVHCLTPQYDEPGRARVTVNIALGRERGNYKLRLYFNEADRRCNVVPFAIPSHLADTSNDFASPSAKALFGRLECALAGAPDGATLWPGEAVCQARLFTASLDLGLQIIDELLGDVFTLAGPSDFDRADARMLFGPAADEEVFPAPRDTQTHRPAMAVPAAGDAESTSPFLKSVGDQLVARTKALAKAGDALTMFKALFDTLAQLVGASDPGKYQLTWPFSKEEVLAKEYLRLRIGPTFDDLVTLISRLAPQAATSAGEPGRGLPRRHLVSAILDCAIDSGAVVPTLALYEGRYFRVYRKGESEQRDRAADRVSYAWHCYGKPLSLTRFSKINVILAFSADLAPVLSPSSLLRGNAASLHATCLDKEDAEIARYLRDTGRLQVANNSEAVG